MLYRLMLSLVLCIALFSGSASAADNKTYSIEGTVRFHRNADVILLLLTKDALNDITKNSYSLTLKPDTTALSTGLLPFTMTNVPKGSYVLLAYQDLNNDKALDKKFFMFAEPWGTFRPQRPGMGYGLNFNDLKFHLSKNLKDIKIRLTE